MAVEAVVADAGGTGSRVGVSGGVSGVEGGAVTGTGTEQRPQRKKVI